MLGAQLISVTNVEGNRIRIGWPVRTRFPLSKGVACWTPGPGHDDSGKRGPRHVSLAWAGSLARGPPKIATLMIWVLFCQLNGRLQGAFFIFIFFISVFYKNIFLIWKFTEIYPGRPAAGRPGPGCRAAGANLQKKETKLQPDPWEPAARLGGGRPPTPI